MTLPCGQWCGAQLRLRSAARPPSSIPSSHFFPVFRTTLYRAHRSIMVGEVPVVSDEAFALVEGAVSNLGILAPAAKVCRVTHVPGLKCYLCTQSVPGTG